MNEQRASQDRWWEAIRALSQHPLFGEGPQDYGELVEVLRAEARFRRAIERASRAGLAAVELSGRQSYVNAAFCEMVGWPEEALVGAYPPYLYWPSDQQAAIMAAFERTLAGDTPQDGFVLTFQRRNGERFDAWVLLSEVEGEQGEVAGWLASVSDISEQTQIERALRESEARFRSVVESNLLGIGFWRSDGVLTDANSLLCDLLGYEVEAFRSGQIRWMDITPPEYDHLDQQALEAVQATGRCVPFEKEYIRRDGSRIPVLLGAAALNEARTEGVFFVLDLSEQKRAVQERGAVLAQHRTLEERLTLLIKASGSLLESPRLDDVLPAILSLAQELVEADAYALWRVDPLTPEWRAICSMGLSAAYQVKVVGAMQGIRQVAPDPILIPNVGELPDFMSHRREGYLAEGIQALLVLPLKIRGEYGGTLVFYYRAPHTFEEMELRVSKALANLAAAAITTAELYEEQRRLHLQAERAQQEQTLLAEASRLLASSLDYNTTLESVVHLPLPHFADLCTVYMAEPDGRVKQLALAHALPQKEEALAALFAYQDRHATPSQHEHGVLHVLRTAQPILVPEIKDSLLEEVAQNDEHLAILRAVGFQSYLLVPMQARERVVGVLVFVSATEARRFGPEQLNLARELAHRAAMAVDNARLYQAAQAAVRQREQFLSIASHELRTPLTSLLGYIQLLQRRAQREDSSASRDERALEVIGEQGRRLDRLVNALLDISRIEQGQLSIERTTLDLLTIVERVVAEIRPTLEQHQLDLIVSPTPLWIEGDALRLHQVVDNLISNAVKYSPEEGRIVVRVQQVGGQAQLQIADWGIGIPPAALPHLFKRFYRADNVMEHFSSGMGIGLYVVQEIVELHGGQIHVESEEGVGSTFTITLPLQPPP